MDNLPAKLDEYPKGFDSWAMALADMGMGVRLETEMRSFYPISGEGFKPGQFLEYFAVELRAVAANGRYEIEAECKGHGQTPFEALQAAVKAASYGVADYQANYRSW